MGDNRRVRCDVAGLTAMISQVGRRAVRGISDAMRDHCEQMFVSAKHNAPRDTGSLESALQIHEDRGGVNGRLRIWIDVDVTAPFVPNSPNASPSQKVVGDYALLMERHLLPYGDGGGERQMHARYGTQAKGPQAGGRYLERAIEGHRVALLARARAIAKRAAQR